MTRILGLAGVFGLAGTGCTFDPGDFTGIDRARLEAVTAKATTVAQHVGGSDGFGGTLMDGYFGHMPSHMGFWDEEDLAQPGMPLTVRLENRSFEDGTFQIAYFASFLDHAEQMMTVEVGAGQTVEVEIPCSEIVGLGSLEVPARTGCVLAGGLQVGNGMAVPGFLGTDFTCPGVYECVLMPDIDDLDGEGDTDELILLSGPMQSHMTDGGPWGHRHGFGMGMMGIHLHR